MWVREKWEGIWEKNQFLRVTSRKKITWCQLAVEYQQQFFRNLFTVTRKSNLHFRECSSFPCRKSIYFNYLFISLLFNYLCFHPCRASFKMLLNQRKIPANCCLSYISLHFLHLVQWRHRTLLSPLSILTINSPKIKLFRTRSAKTQQNMYSAINIIKQG